MPKQAAPLFYVRKSHYMTYAEIAEHGERPWELVARGLTFEAAQALVEQLGFGHSVHEQE